MEVQAGNQTDPSFAQPELWSYLDALSESDRPLFIRGDCQWGSEKAMVGTEQCAFNSCAKRSIGFLFKLKQTGNVKKLIRQIFDKPEWEDAGQNWQGRSEKLRLDGLSKERRVIVLRRPLPAKPVAEAGTAGKKRRGRKRSKQMVLDLPEIKHKGIEYEYVVLATSLSDGVMTIAQHYRDRGRLRE